MSRTIAIFACCAVLAGPGEAAAQAVAVTFDDLPSHSAVPPGETRVSIATRILAAFREAGVGEVYGFVNGFQLARDSGSEAVLGLWRAAGHPLANHTWSHMRLNDNPADAFTADVTRNEPLLERYMGTGDWRWFRYPYLAEGDTPEKRAAARTFLAQHRYRVASVTMSFDDWAYNEPFARCSSRGDAAAIATLETRWLNAAESSLAYYRGLSQTLYGREIPLVLLMHVGAFDARLLPRLLAMYRSRGVRFVTLQEAEADAFYADETNSAASPEPATLENAMRARGLMPPPKGWRSDDLGQLCR